MEKIVVYVTDQNPWATTKRLFIFSSLSRALSVLFSMLGMVIKVEHAWWGCSLAIILVDPVGAAVLYSCFSQYQEVAVNLKISKKATLPCLKLSLNDDLLGCYLQSLWFMLYYTPKTPHGRIDCSSSPQCKLLGRYRVCRQTVQQSVTDLWQST